MSTVPLYIPFKLGDPVGLLCRGNTSLATAGMQMPKATVDEDDSLSGRKNHIGTARQSLDMETKAISQRMGYASYSDLRLSVLAPDAAHVL